MRVLVFMAALVLAPAASAAEWREAETDHFRIVSSGNEKDLQKFAERLEYFHALLGMASGIKESGQQIVKVRVFLVPDLADVKRLYGDMNSSVAGYYSPQEDGALAVVPRSTGGGVFNGQVVLFHEYTHHHMLQYTPSAYPSWYVEGFAEITSTASFERKDTIVYGRAASHRQYELELLTRYSPADMVDGTYLKDREKKRGWSYGDAWLLTHYLTFSDERRGQLRAYLNAINAGRPLEEAAQAFGDLGKLRQDVGVYFRSRNFSAKLVPIPPDAAGKITIRTLSEAEGDLVYYEIELDRKTTLPTKPDDQSEEGEEADEDKKKVKEGKPYEERLAEAKLERDRWLANLESTVMRHSGDPAAWRLLADARCASEQFAGCLDAAERTLVLSPDDARAKLRRAQASIAVAEELPEEQRIEQVLTAQAQIVDVINAHPNDPVALLAYYRTFDALDIAPPKEATDALALAVRLVPQLPGPRLTLAHALFAENRFREARVVLKPLAYAPHGGSASEAARALLDKIEEQLGES